MRQDLSGGEWQLVIRDVAFSDAGEYECQVNTSPVLSHTISLAVVGKIKIPASLSLLSRPAQYKQITLSGPESSLAHLAQYQQHFNYYNDFRFTLHDEVKHQKYFKYFGWTRWLG